MGGKPQRPANVFDFREELKRQKRKRQSSRLKAIGVMLAGGLLGGAAIVTTPTIWDSLIAATAAPQFAVCGMIRQTCVVDGDTFWLDGEKIRIADIDTPEISEPQCQSEYDRGIEARNRLVVLLNDGPFKLSATGDHDEDQYGRKLRVVVRDGQSLGDRLVSEGLARTWSGRREPWC